MECRSMDLKPHVNIDQGHWLGCCLYVSRETEEFIDELR